MRKAPLYKDYQTIPTAENIRNKDNYHRGLWFDRFFKRYYYDQTDVQNEHNWQLDDPNQKNRSSDEKGQPKKEQPKKEWIDSVIKGQCGLKAALLQNALQQAQLCESLKGQQVIASNTWNVAIGMGNNHPVENGFSWHPSLGTPYLTGAALKGLLRTWIEVWAGLDAEACKQKCLRWFGSEVKFPTDEKEADAAITAQENQTGLLIFFDAVPIVPVTLSCDIMTAHMGEWYSQGDQITAANRNETLPADWHDPNPIAFLAVKEICLQFAIAPRPCQNPIQAPELAEAMQYLRMALEFLGIGAKTAVGYGRFEEDIQQTQAFMHNQRDYVRTQREYARTQMSVEDAFRDELTDSTISFNIRDKSVAKKFISKATSKATQQFYIDQGANWDSIMDILLEVKMSRIQIWQTFDKNTIEAKAYKNLVAYLPHLRIDLGDAANGQVRYCQRSEKRHYHSGQANNFAIDYYRQQAIKSIPVKVLGNNQSAWYSFLSAWHQQILDLDLEDIESLFDDVFELMKVEEEASAVLSSACLNRLNNYLAPYNLSLSFYAQSLDN